MQYQGGKSRIAAEISRVMLDEALERHTYWEPFVGAGSVAAMMAPHFTRPILSDASPDLILMWEAIQFGWEPPDYVSEEEYAELRRESPSPLRGFAGYGCSFGGKFFGGYAREKRGESGGKSFAAQCKRSCARKMQGMKGAEFHHIDYQLLTPEMGWVIYADPPYAGTTGYKHGDYNPDEFLTAVDRWASLGATVFISEYRQLRPSWQQIWTKEVALQLKGGTERKDTRQESLFVVRA